MSSTPRLHTRVVVLTYFEDDLNTHLPANNPDEFFRALGRAVSWGLARDQMEDTVQLTQVHLRKDEWLSCYHDPCPVGGYGLGGLGHEVHRLAETLTCETPFVIGAVKGDDGKYGFHS